MTSSSGGVQTAPEDFNPISQEFLRDPQRFMGPARRDMPVMFLPGLNVYAIMRHADVDAALKDFRTFSNASLAYVPVPEEFKDQVPEGFFATGALISQDPPEHTARRKMINPGFTRGQMKAMEAPIEQIAHDLIDGFIADGRCDAMRDYCYQVSLRSIVHLMGLPTDDFPRLYQLAQDQAAVVSTAIKPMSPEREREVWQRIVDTREYLKQVAHDRRTDPSDDLISIMVNATGEDGAAVLDDDQISTHLTELVFAGTDTTANHMGSMIQLLDRDPAALAELRADPSLWPQAVEEGLRIRAASNGLFRIVTEDVDVAGVTIPKGSVAWLAIGSANQDDDVFPDPDRFDIHRGNLGESIAFGKGRHFCMGAPLTRTEAPIGLRVLYERIPDLKVVPDQTLTYDPVLVAVVLEHLQVTWEAPPAG